MSDPFSWEFFSSFTSLVAAVTQICSHGADEDGQAIAAKKRERFVQLGRAHFDNISVPSSSTSSHGSEESPSNAFSRDTLVDVLWTVDQACDNQVEPQDVGKDRANLGLLVKDIEVR